MKDDVPPKAPHARIIKGTFYEVMNNTDDIEGRGREFVAGVYSTRKEAERAAKGQYVMGSNCPVYERKGDLVKVSDDEYYLLGAPVLTVFEDPAEIRRAALAKLSAKEKEVLGLK